MIFHEINCFLLLEDEHIPHPPSRTECYWMAIARYGKVAVDNWIESLPWKVPLEKPWAGTKGIDVIEELYESRRIVKEQIDYFRNKLSKITCEG